MDYRRLGKSGLTVSAIGIGCNNFGAANDEAATKTAVHKALDVGITLFDTADFCGGRGQSDAATAAKIDEISPKPAAP